MQKIYLTSREVDTLKEFCDNNLETGYVEITQTNQSDIGLTTLVAVEEAPETLTDITDYDTW